MIQVCSSLTGSACYLYKQQQLSATELRNARQSGSHFSGLDSNDDNRKNVMTAWKVPKTPKLQFDLAKGRPTLEIFKDGIFLCFGEGGAKGVA